jgi:BirA family biotin operon repressor/biotin-[acetyl-CoA-carboxylase] ligase
MTKLKHPELLIDLGHVGENGLPLNSEPWFQKELELCKEWGFQLKIAEGRVCLLFDQDQLVPYWIQKETPAIAWDWLRVSGFLRTESTNSEALEMARRGAPGGTLIYAEEQTAGKGRKGRNWFSPAKTGLYFTLILRPKQPRKFWPLLTHVASIALVETLKALSDRKIVPHALDIDLKWPNDVLLSGKKCAGILLETIRTEGENHAAAVGIGINVHKGSVPESLASEAACLDEMTHTFVPRRQLLVRLLHHFQLGYLVFERGKHAEVLERWKSMSSMWDGTQVWIGEGTTKRAAVTCGLDEIGALRVRTPEGILETVLAGDVSVRRDMPCRDFRLLPKGE